MCPATLKFIEATWRGRLELIYNPVVGGYELVEANTLERAKLPATFLQLVLDIQDNPISAIVVEVVGEGDGKILYADDLLELNVVKETSTNCLYVEFANGDSWKREKLSGMRAAHLRYNVKVQSSYSASYDELLWYVSLGIGMAIGRSLACGIGLKLLA